MRELRTIPEKMLDWVSDPRNDECINTIGSALILAVIIGLAVMNY